MKIAEAYAEVTIRTGPFNKQLKEMEAATTKSTNSISQRFKAMAPGIQKIGKTMTIAGGVITGALAACLYKAVAVGDELDKMSKRTGVAVEELSALKYAAEISGTELGTVENSLRFLARAMDDTSKGTGEAKDAFEKLGISVTDVQGNLRPTVEVMKEAATKIAGMTNETEKVSAATDIFGSRYGTELLPLLKEGGEGIEDLMNKAKDLGLVVSTDAATAAAEFNDRMTEMKSTLGALSLKIGDVLIPAIKPIVEEITKIIGKMSKWTEEHPGLTKLITKFALVIGGLMVAGGPLLMLAPTIAGIATALPGLIAAFGPLLGPLGIIMAIAAAVGLLYKAWTEDWGGIQEKTRAVINTITGGFTKFVNFITQNILNPIIEGFESFANIILGTIGDLVGGIIDLFGKLPDFMLKVFGTSKEEVEAFAEDIREKLSLELGRIPKIAEDAFKWQEPVIEKTKEMGKGMEGFGKITGPVLDKAKEGMEGFGEATKGTAEELAKLKERMDKLRAGAESMGLEQEKMQKLIAQTAMTATEKVEDLRKQMGLTRESIADVFAATEAREAAAEAGTEAGEAFAYGKSPGGFLPTIEEAIKKHLAPIYRVQEEEMLADWNAFLDEITLSTFKTYEELHSFMEGLASKDEATLARMFQDWQKQAEKIANVWESFTSRVKDSFEDAFTGFVKGTSTVEQAWNSLVDVIRNKFLTAMAATILAQINFNELIESIDWTGSFEDLKKQIKDVMTMVHGLWNEAIGLLGKTGEAAAAEFNKWKINVDETSDSVNNLTNNVKKTVKAVATLSEDWPQMGWQGLEPKKGWPGWEVFPEHQAFVGNYQLGGLVPRTGLARVEKGERITPAGKSAITRNYTFNFTVMPGAKMTKSELRQMVQYEVRPILLELDGRAI